ncbi:efflux RND transporter periplasmic adaptor subunit [Vibrio sp. SS-MA-C1-2]|uniref:efflux RND transporter periplasmic adaptor subunit n=1 Tax=Vibrio sp. SS-MA-C1-2 TaxID=2908646 RepID=UPI001F238567|nr:efflux RND transporter periplasmic adaptor subunit [Vibrio sp. SS-MA-C1-2]UJF17160.1 efflux RND transporter periplasmic adaptor subunit [Vibrio sp. SS-MA-C1-2]
MMKLLPIASALLFLSGCQQEVETHDITPPVVKVISVTTETNNNKSLPAMTQVADKAQLSFQLKGDITTLLVKEGQKVHKGQLLATLNTTELDIVLENAKSKLQVAENNLKRAEYIYHSGSLAQSEFDELKAKRDISFDAYQLAELRLQYSQLSAPYDGIISIINVENYESVNIGQPILSIYNPEMIEIKLPISDALFINSNQTSLDNLEAWISLSSGEKYSARLKEYTTQKDPDLAVYTATFEMPMPNGKSLTEGIGVEVSAKDNKQFAPIIYLPIEAVFTQDGETLSVENSNVWVVDKQNRVHKTKVEIAAIYADKVQIIAGVTHNQRVVTAGIDKLIDGMEITIMNGGYNNDK